MPKTSMSRSFDGRPKRRSRTKPPTHSARPPPSRIRVAIARDCSLSRRASAIVPDIFEIGRGCQDVHVREWMQHEQILVPGDQSIREAVNRRLEKFVVARLTAS